MQRPMPPPPPLPSLRVGQQQVPITYIFNLIVAGLIGGWFTVRVPSGEDVKAATVEAAQQDSPQMARIESELKALSEKQERTNKLLQELNSLHRQLLERETYEASRKPARRAQPAPQP
jgi:K+-sensing histidine kinase KdpD